MRFLVLFRTKTELILENHNKYAFLFSHVSSPDVIGLCNPKVMCTLWEQK